MKKFIVCISALVLVIFVAAVGAIVFFSFTLSTMVVAVASGDDPKDSSDTNDKISAEITSYVGECVAPTDNDTSYTTLF